MDLSLEAIKSLREQTGAGVMDCKRALERADGNPDEAVNLLREQGLALAARKAHRETREGVVEAYLHSGNRIGALVEVNCESDFVGRTPEMRELAHDLAMQVAAMAPRYVAREEIPPEDDGNPEESCLVLQPFIKDPTRTVQDMLGEAVARVGENVRVRRFARFALGEE